VSVSYYNPAQLPTPGGVGVSGIASVSYDNPVAAQTSQQALTAQSFTADKTESAPTVSVATAVSLVNGPSATAVTPVQLSRRLGAPYVLTIRGANLSGATTVRLIGLENDVVVSAPSLVSADGRVLTVEVFVLPTAPLGISEVVINGPGWSTSRVPHVRIEVVQ
jgi:hypothetical protein